MPKRISFEVALMAFDCVRSQGQGYFNDVVLPVHPVVAWVQLRSADQGNMVIPGSLITRFGQRSFCLSAQTETIFVFNGKTLVIGVSNHALIRGFLVVPIYIRHPWKFCLHVKALLNLQPY